MSPILKHIEDNIAPPHRHEWIYRKSYSGSAKNGDYMIANERIYLHRYKISPASSRGGTTHTQIVRVEITNDHIEVWKKRSGRCFQRVCKQFLLADPNSVEEATDYTKTLVDQLT